ncbi:MAG: hypothetical protein Q8S41_04630 [Lutibacter sp.]|nr:hypothetical protein [Lutibacter sp.]
MKTINTYILSAIFIAFLTVNTETFAQVGIGTTNPDGSAMLDIQSNAKGVLIPRMLTSERTAIATPANGLLVFDTNTQSFWFRDGSLWKELSSGTPNKIIDADGDTRIEVEKTANEDKIRFTTLGAERMIIDEFGNTRIGNGADNTYIETDGSLSYEGAATRYDDLTIPVTSTRIGAAGYEPTFEMQATGGGGRGVYVYYFAGGSVEQELFFTVQIPHGRKYNTNIFPHVHWAPESDLGAAGVVWALEYNWANLGEVLGTTNIIYGSSKTSLIGGPANADKHLITAFNGGGADEGIVGSGKTLSSMLICRVFRATLHADDTYTGKAGLLQIDFHIEYDADGSRQLYVK